MKWFFYFLLTTPYLYIAYLANTTGLGANPAETINKRLGDFTLYLVLANFYWASFNILVSRKPLRRFTPLRRPLGVAVFIYAFLHFTSYIWREGDWHVAIKQLLHKTYLIFGFSSLLILFALALTSNNFSVRKLRPANWKKLHQFVYLAYFLITAHIFLIEKRSLLSNKWTLFPMLFLLFVRFCLRLRPAQATA